MKALLVIDMQNGVCKGDPEIYHFDRLVATVNERIAHARQSREPLIFIRHTDEDLPENSDQWQLIDELDKRNTDWYVQKIHADSFYRTNLKAVLDQLQVNQLEICGAQVEYCVDTTIKVAHDLGYQLLMTRGAASTLDNELLDAASTIEFYEHIWNHRFLELIE